MPLSQKSFNLLFCYWFAQTVKAIMTFIHVMYASDIHCLHKHFTLATFSAGRVRSPDLVLTCMPKQVNSSVGSTTFSMLIGRPRDWIKLFRDKNALGAELGGGGAPLLLCHPGRRMTRIHLIPLGHVTQSVTI